MAKNTDESRDLLSDTMKQLFPPRVEYARKQHESLKRLSNKTGKPVKELVAEAIDLYLSYQNAS